MGDLSEVKRTRRNYLNHGATPAAARRGSASNGPVVVSRQAQRPFSVRHTALPYLCRVARIALAEPGAASGT
jgi:hypothetical protein